jgi:hypothetical protein
MMKKIHTYKNSNNFFFAYLFFGGSVITYVNDLFIKYNMALRLLKGVRELRFVLCQSGASSEPLRKYIANNYESIRLSPARITVRECDNSTPTAIATFDYGIERTLDLRKLSTN